MPEPSPTPAAPDVPTLLARLARKGFVVVTGKGGVGKSVVTALLGRRFAAAGHRTLVIEVDPRESLHRQLGAPPSGGEIVEVAPGLSLQHLKPRTVVDRVIEERVKIGAVVRRLQGSAVYGHFVDGAPGLKELAILEHARRQLARSGEGGRFAAVVLDAPATGHGVSLLRAPRLVAEVAEGGPFGSIAEEIAAFVRDPARSAIAVVTQAEEMPVEEALDLAALLDEQLGRTPDLLVVNGLYPALPAASGGEPPGEGEGEGEDAGAGSGDELLELWRRRRAVNERELARLDERWRGPRIELPLLPLSGGAELLAALDRCLDEGAAGGMR